MVAQDTLPFLYLGRGAEHRTDFYLFWLTPPSWPFISACGQNFSIEAASAVMGSSAHIRHGKLTGHGKQSGSKDHVRKSVEFVSLLL